MNKSSAIYRIPDDIINLKVRIRIKEIGAGDDDLLEEIRTFRWQQKIFGLLERHFYLDGKNCVTDLEKKYHAEVCKLSEKNNVLFSYVNEDGFETEDGHEVMHFMADLGGDRAANLCTIAYDPIQKVLRMLPDFTQFEPYSIHVEGDAKRVYQYRVDDVSEKIPIDLLLKENEILDRINLHQIKAKLDKGHADFEIPPKSKLHVSLFLEILSARNFEYNDIYVRYFIDLPSHWDCKDLNLLEGCTQTSHWTDSDGRANFGLPFEIFLEYDIQRIEGEGIPDPPYVYFEVVSKDSWDRFRTEGLAYVILPVADAGVYNYELRCLRICPEGVTGELRRFFVGDFSNYDSADWLSISKERKSRINRYGVRALGTGEVNVRIGVLQQSQAFSEDFASSSITGKRRKFLLDKLNTSVLVKSIEQVVSAFKVAKRRMIEARKNV